jgi:hypothetical protein
MGGRGTYAAGNFVAYTYETVGYIEDVKVLRGLGNKHDLPVESHSSSAYIKLHSDGTLSMLRIYDSEHYLTMEIAYHPERKLTGNSDRVLHVHYYDRNLNRTTAAYLDRATFEKYEKYLKGIKWYD